MDSISAINKRPSCVVKRIPLKGYEGHYEIDSNGLIYSLDKTVKNSLGRVYLYKGTIRKPALHGTGYFVIRLYKEGVAKTFRYHRLVAENLIPNPENKPFVNHKDGNKKNNHPSNLEWVTEKENTNHAISTGLFPEIGRDIVTGRFLKIGEVIGT